MHTENLSDEVDKLWLWAARQLERVYIPPAPSVKTLEDLSALLPTREARESLTQWLQRCQAELSKVGKAAQWRQILTPPQEVVFGPQRGQGKPGARQYREKSRTRQYRAVRLVQIVRLAADGGREEYPLPDPDTALESENGVFRVFIQAAPADKIRIRVQVRGVDAQDYAGKRLGIVEVDDDRLVADIQLDDFAGGETEIADTPEIRRALLAVIIVLIQAEEA